MSAMDETTHPARSLPDKQRIDYLLVVAAIAYADRQIAEAERENLRDLSAALGLSNMDADRVVATMVAPHPSQLARVFDSFKRGDLRYTLLTDATVLAFADGQVESGEAETIARFAQALDIDTAQAVMIGRYVEEVVQGKRTESLSDELAQKLGQIPSQGVVGRLFARLRGKAR
jgi:uncharacterized tellurite resistance protein B-like protein